MAASAQDTQSLFESYFQAIREGQRSEALAVVDSACSTGIDLRTLYLEVFQPALWEIGRLWQENELSVADEHLATAITQTAMLRAFQDRFSWKPSGGHSLIAACADLEQHDLGLRMICDLLDLEGWDTTYLGAAVPIEDLVKMVRRKRPDAVAISVSLDKHIPRAEDAIREIRETVTPAPTLLLGGRAFAGAPEQALALGADLTAADAWDAAISLARSIES